jgi:hypothetical protein
MFKVLRGVGVEMPDLASRDSATGDTRMLEVKWIERNVGAESKLNELPDLN